MTLSELSYNIKNIAKGGQGNSDDDNLNIRQIEFWIRAYRARGILQTTDFGKAIDPQMVQDLGCMPLEEVDMADPDCPSCPKCPDLPDCPTCPTCQKCETCPSCPVCPTCREPPPCPTCEKCPTCPTCPTCPGEQKLN